MKFEPEKILQNIELRLRGRTAIFAISEAVMAIALWLILKDYSIHPTPSIIAGSVLLIGILGFSLLGMLGKQRPDESPIKSFTNIEQFGVSIVHGIGSHKEMVQIMRAIWGGRRIPPPTYMVKGSANNEGNYVPLSPDKSNAIVERIEQEIETLLSDAITARTQQPEQPKLEQSRSEEQGPAPLIKGKVFPKEVG